MAEEHVRTSANEITTKGSSGHDGQGGVKAGGLYADAAARPRGSELLLLARWLLGLLIILACGWGGIAFVAWAAYRLHLGLKFENVVALAGVLSLGVFFLLERNLWLSRFMALRLTPRSAPWKEAVFFWLTGVPGLLWRSSEAQLPMPAAAQPKPETSTSREVIETIVFVVVLVLLLKSFAAEAFVIPTGSMAETLLGYNKYVTCPKCGHEFPVNCSNEVDPPEGPPIPVVGCMCPNCQFEINFDEEKRRDPKFQVPSPSTGDRVLVGKFLYDLPGKAPERWDVVVFKFPGDFHFPVSGPQKNHVPMNYIKRLDGLGGETIGIWYGKLYVLPAADLPPEKAKEYEARRQQVRPEELWKPENMYPNDLQELLREGKGFKLLRKPPTKQLSMRRIVYDNDHPAKDLKDLRRWEGADGWQGHGEHGFQAAAGDQTAWLRYRHVLRPYPGQPGTPKPQLITDLMGYNTYQPRRDDLLVPPPNWVGDLMVECEVAIDQPGGELVLELSKGADRFRARWNLTDGKCTLQRLAKPNETSNSPADADFIDLDSKPTNLKGKGNWRVRFANVDERLTVWVDDDLPFGDGVTYDPVAQRGPYPNDLQPASIGVQGGGVRADHLQLWRDTYYTLEPGQADASLTLPRVHGDNPLAKLSELHDVLSDPSRWSVFRDLSCKTLYVQPGHYLCLGDNSPESSDGRSWGLVPERLMLGRALLVYYPFGRAGRIR